MKMNMLRKGLAAFLIFVMLGTVAFGANISSVKFKKGVVTAEYYVGGDDATIWVYNAADPDEVLYVDQEDADGSFSFGLPEFFDGEAITIRVGGENEPVAEETVYVTPPPAPTPDPESVAGGGIYNYVNKEDFTTMTIDYDEKYMLTEADYKVDANAASYAKGQAGMIVYEEYSGTDGVFYLEGHALASPEMTFGFDPIKEGRAKISVKYMYSTFPQAGSDGECFFFSVRDGSTNAFAIRNCVAQYTSDKVPVSGMYFYDGTTDYTRYRTAGKDATWQTLTYIVDMDTKTFILDHNGTIYGSALDSAPDFMYDADKDGVEETYKACSFYGDVTELSQIYFKGGRQQWQGNYYLDEIKVMAVDADEYPTHTITYYNDDMETVLGTTEIKDGRRAIHIDAPSRKGYTFMGWYNADGTLADVSNVTSDMDVYAKYLPRCTVKFYSEDMVTELASVTVDYGTEAKIANPTKDGYTFMGWADINGTKVDLTSITENLTVYEWFEKQSTLYYYDLDAEGNATLYETQIVDYATNAILPEAPTSRTDAKFIGWGLADGTMADLSKVQGDRKVYAIYGALDGEGTETFEDFIDRVNAVAGEQVMTETGVKGDNYDGIQGNTGFANEFMFAYGDSRVNYIQSGIRIDTIDGDKVLTHVQATAFNHDNIKIYPEQEETTDIIKLGYDFKINQWQNAQSASNNAGGFGSIYGKKSGTTNTVEVIKITASTYLNRGLAVQDPTTNQWVSIIPYNSANPDLEWHHIDYYIDLGSQKVIFVLDGEFKASVPLGTTEVSTIDYYFLGLLHGGHVGNQSRFSIDDINVKAYTNSGVTVAPTYYTVTFLAEDGETVLDTQRVAEGKPAVYGGVIPTKEPTIDTVYTFNGWSADISSVINDMRVTPKFTSSSRTYNVTFMIDGTPTVVPTAYGQAAVAPANPTKAADAQYTYSFTGWDKTFDNITSELTVTAQFSHTLRSYTVTFYDDDKTTVLKSETVAYGSGATAPADPTKEGNDVVSYTFAGWVDVNGNAIDFSNITGETDVYASYDEHRTMETITIKWGDVDNNGVVNVSDSGAIVTALAGGKKVYGDYTIGTVFADNLKWGDVDNNGVVNVSDCGAIVTALAGGKKVYGDYTIGNSYSFEIPVE